MKRVHKNTIKILGLFILVFLLSIMPSIDTLASGSWVVRENDTSLVDFGHGGSGGDDSEPDSVIKHYWNLFYYIAEGIRGLLNWSDNMNRISIDGLILGSLQGTGAAAAQFDLNYGNGYGIVGASFYTILRRLVFSLLFVMTCWMLVGQVFHNGAKGRMMLKEMLQNIVFVFMLLYIMPQFVQFFLVLRDNAMISLGGRSSITGILIQFRDMYRDDPGLINGFLYCAAMFANFFYIGSYVTIALTETILFGLFPVFALLSVKQKKMLENWMIVFFSNLAIPLIDYALLMLPVKITEAGAGFEGMATIVSLVIIWSVIPARNGILKVFGNATGGMVGGGMAGLGAMAMMAARMLFAGKGGGGGGSSAQSASELRSNAEMAERMTEDLGHNQVLAAKEIGDIDSIMADAGIEHSTTAMTQLEGGGYEFIDSTDAADVSGVSGTTEVEADDLSGTVDGGDFSAMVEGAETSGSLSGEVAGEIADAELAAGLEAQDVTVGADGRMGTLTDVSVFDQGSLEDAVKAHDYNSIESSFYETENRNLENMEMTRARIGELESELPEIQEKGQMLQSMDESARQFVKENDGLVGQNNEEIGYLRSANVKLQGQLGTPNGAAAQAQIDQNNARIQSLQMENQKYNQAMQTIRNNDRIVTGADGKQTTFLKAEVAKYNTEYNRKATQLESAKRAYGKQQMLERDMANARKVSGRSGEVFESSAQFKAAMTAYNKQIQSATYKNFESNPGFSFMPAEMKADFYRQRAARVTGEKIGGMLGGVAGATTGATMAGFGGANTMVMAGFGGAIVGKSAGEAVGGAAGSGAYGAGAAVRDKFESNHADRASSERSTQVEQPVRETGGQNRSPRGGKRRQKFTDTSSNSSFADMQQRAADQVQRDNAQSDVSIVQGEGKYEAR